MHTTDPNTPENKPAPDTASVAPQGDKAPQGSSSQPAENEDIHNVTGSISLDADAFFSSFIHSLNGSPASAFSLIVPKDARHFFAVRNNTKQHCNVQVNGGGSVPLPGESSAMLYADGTTIVKLGGSLDAASDAEIKQTSFKNHRRMAWAAFVLGSIMGVILIALGVALPDMAKNISSMSFMIGTVYTVWAGVVAAYFGSSAWVNVTRMK